MRILVIRRDNIGDLVCTTPLIAALRARYPDAHIAALVNSYNAAVLDGNPDLDAVHVYTKLKHRLPGQSRLRIIAGRFRMLANLRRQTFDYVILAKAGFDRQGLALARQLRCREIVGYVPDSHTPPAITRPVPPVDFDATHEVEAVARLGQAVDVGDANGPLHIYANRALAAQWLERISTGEAGVMRVAVHISAREPSRVWATERWVRLLRETAAGEAVRFILLWSPGASTDPRHPGDDAKAATIAKACQVVPAPTESLADLVAVLSHCHAFIGADGGAMHIAAGLGLPVVALFENLESKKRRWYPWRVPYEMVVPATRDIGDITVDQVKHAWQRLSRRTALAARTPAPMPSGAHARG